MFQDKYMNAYDKIHPERDMLFTEEKIEKYMEEGVTKETATKKSPWRTLRPVMVASVALCLMLALGLPVAAKNIPGVYDVLKRHVPGLLDYMVPVQKSDNNQGIVFQVEAINIKGNTADVVVSFSDDGTGDYIHGMVDMYDSYHLKCFSVESNIGGCSFLEYDPVEDKAYFRVGLTSTTGTFDAGRLEFSVGKLLTECRSVREEIPLDNVLHTCNVKSVSVNGRSGSSTRNLALDKLAVAGDAEDPRPGNRVLDIPLDKYGPETMEITGVAYMDGILRVQILRGNFTEANRHMYIFMQNESGEVVDPHMSVMWQEEIAGETVSLEEFYFVITNEQLETYTLWGDGEVRDGCVKGNWSITFDLE